MKANDFSVRVIYVTIIINNIIYTCADTHACSIPNAYIRV